MGETAKQVGHEIAGMAEKAAGAVANNDELKDKGAEHLEEAEELQRAWDSSRAGSIKDSSGRGVMDRK